MAWELHDFALVLQMQPQSLNSPQSLCSVLDHTHGLSSSFIREKNSPTYWHRWLGKKNWFCSLVLELQHIAGPDVERQQGWGKIGSRALSPLDMQKLIYFSNSCCSLGPALTSQRRSPTPYTRAKWQLIHHGLKPAHPCLSSVIC